MASLAKMKDKNSRLPLHIAADIGLKWFSGMNTILNANIYTLDVLDPLTGLHPLMPAAVGKTYDLDGVYGFICVKS